MKHQVFSKRELASLILVVLTAFTFGVSLISLSCLYGLIEDHFTESTGKTYTIYHEALIPGTHFLGAFIAGIIFKFVSFTNDKVKLIVANVIYMIVFATPLMTLDFAHYLTSRFILGFALDLTSGSISSYIDAIAPDHIRGFLASLQPVGIVGGLFVGSMFNFFGNKESYRIPFVAMLVFLVLQTIGFAFIRSPHPRTPNTFNTRPSMKELIRTPGSAKSIAITVVFHAFHHLSGINFLTFQQSCLFSSSKYPNLMTSSSLFVSFITTAFCGLIVDRFGRKTMSIISSTIMAFGMIPLAMDRFPLLGVIICFIGFNLGLAVIPWIISAEIFPSRYTSTGFEFGVSFNWLFGFITTTLLHPLNYNHAQVMSGIYGGLCLVFSVFVLLCVRETKGKPKLFQ
ncbi:glucose transporter type 1 [Encephalitozoon intestinalis ATCC 50506]|uniref:Glucose transporter type 1 n=1 Tax=Encephalitozoon intestinalis (strain ATCC 50506) TaxID=876142 RepID=E0S834_ENCIT|nr:glucose transporter type 1 [Encephalitozoon intestinalis ATCC 50506]ADM11869.1 glucose transporter type 1 [Encephalitozoon intestinalis ATCC 50506]UTX45624.1 hexose transporter [Encephalitozoon intestinalis]